jgi:membrane-associated HD superfamily phosphohydrolase
MNSNSEKLTMEELDALNQTEQPEILPEKVVVEIPEEELLAMQDTQAATLKLVRQMATEMPRLTREIELQNFTRVLSENMELKRKNALLEQERNLAKTEEKIIQAGKTSERSIEQTERRIATELDEIRSRLANLWQVVFVTIGSSVALATIVSAIFFLLLR